MSKRNIVVIGASAGGFEALKQLIRDLPANLEAAIFIVWHLPGDAEGLLPNVLNRHSALPCKTAEDKEPVQTGRIYVAPPDRHMLIERDRVRIIRGPKENRFRPAIDPLFRSAAYAYGPRVIGIILSGALDDGAAGLWVVSQRGGIAIVQDPSDAEVSAMPENALRSVNTEYRPKIEEMAALISKLTDADRSDTEGAFSPDTRRLDIELASKSDPDGDLLNDHRPLGELTPYTCPECHGVLSLINENPGFRFQCHTGHAFTADSLLAAIGENIEKNLWSAMRSLHESMFLLNHMGDHFAELNQRHLAASYFKKAKKTKQHAQLLRTMINEQASAPHPPTPQSIEAKAAEDGRGNPI